MVSKLIYLLDSFALLAYLNDEPGGGRVQEVLALAKSHKCRLVMSLINLGEVLYITERTRGLPAAQAVQALIESLPLELVEASRDLILDAAHIKASHALSFADAFAVASAMCESAIILTGDPEYQTVDDLVRVEWLIRQT
ncbi:MAG TPA: type II toxin-antitoxin system VapC family toxin [Anaerolineales bacterium]|nr:type II toxin-antitoxin system VapC family toxin [Anaerolineales bacterium]HVN81792.1 type II toxin-antitoxin system VapC family toxin [Terriglobia bacterium]